LRIGFSTNAFTKKSLSYAFRSISKVGFEGVEIVLDVPHAFLPIKKKKLEQLKKQLQNYNLTVTNLNANTVLGWYGGKINSEKFEPSLSNSNQKLRRWRVSYTKEAIDLAGELNSPSICITSGILHVSKKNSNLDFFGKSLQELAIYAEKMNVRLGIEYEPGLLLGSSQDILPFINNNFQNVGLNLDVCHAAVLGENIPNIIEKFGKKIFHTHISDCKNKNHYHLIPGLGDIDFKEMYQSLLKTNYKGFLTGELYTYPDSPEQAAKHTFIYLKNLVN